MMIFAKILYQQTLLIKGSLKVTWTSSIYERIYFKQHAVPSTNVFTNVAELVEGSVGRRVAVVGDFNSDLRRKRKTKFDKVLKTLIEENRLIVVDQMFTQPIDFTFRSHDKKSYSCKQQVSDICHWS